MENSTETFRGPISTSYCIRGSEEYATREIARIFRDYPAAGYNTRITSSTVGCVNITRWNSCD